MLPVATPRKMEADARAFLVVPPTFPETRERARTKTALLAPVRSVVFGGVSGWSAIARQADFDQTRDDPQ
jgi:hypothetical protein